MSKIIPPFIRSPYNYDVTAASDDTAYVESMPSLTVQSMAEDADLNVLMRRFGITGKMPENVRIPEFGDFEGITDYQGALNAVMLAQDEFMAIPAEVRARFENNPQLYLAFCSDEKNHEEMLKMGLLKPGVQSKIKAPEVIVPPVVKKE